MKIELSKYEIRQILTAASDMENDYYDFQCSITDKRTAAKRTKVFEGAMNKLRTALRKNN